jgi:hypothetical protein
MHYTQPTSQKDLIELTIIIIFKPSAQPLKHVFRESLMAQGNAQNITLNEKDKIQYFIYYYIIT